MGNANDTSVKKWPLPLRPEDGPPDPASADPTEQRRVEVEEELHRLDAEIGRLREQMMLLRGLERTREREARARQLAKRYDRLGARFVAVYREWNELP